MEYKTKSVIFGRRPRKNPDGFKTAFFLLYDVTNPLKGEHLPQKDIEFDNIEYIQIPTMDGLRYYLEGNDLVITDITSIIIHQNETTLSFEIKR